MYVQANDAVFISLPEYMELSSPGTTEKNHIAVVIHSAMLKGLVVVADKFHSFNRPENAK
jgi:hypothetical protein